ncbi:MAG: hypothetical protein OIF48_18910 [Silicimonas sp.]|nr:hypothetical protein [Silicimonas sp.]
MFKPCSALFLSALACPANAYSATAEVFCDSRAALIDRLQASYGAERQGRGMRGPDAVVEIWMVPSTGEWTMVQSYADGRSCVIAMGEDWEAMRPAADPA